MGLITYCVAGSYTLTVTSHSVTGVADRAKLQGISGNVKIDQIQIYVQGGTSAEEQLIEIYNLASTTYTAVIAQRYVVGNSSASHVNSLIINYPQDNPLKLTNMLVKKENANSVVYMNLMVR
jgi:hypothetical protein